jgi:hypothetical protein
MSEKEPTVEELRKEIFKLQEKLDVVDKKDTKKEKAVKSLYRWQAFSRPFRRRSAKWIFYLLVLVATIILVLLFLQEFFAALPILALALLAYVLATVPPEIIENEITTQGINVDRHSYLWEELDDFWFAEKYSFTVLEIDTFLSWPRRLFVIIKKEDQEKVKQLLAKYIPYRELPKRFWLDGVAEAFSTTFHKFTR